MLNLNGVYLLRGFIALLYLNLPRGKNLAKSNWEILCGPNLNSRSEMPLIYWDLPLGLFNPFLSAINSPSSTFSGLSPALIIFKAKLWIDYPIHSQAID